jgi:hypothetical protein
MWMSCRDVIQIHMPTLIVDVSEFKLPGEAKQNNLRPECGQPIDTDGVNFEYSEKAINYMYSMDVSEQPIVLK